MAYAWPSMRHDANNTGVSRIDPRGDSASAPVCMFKTGGGLFSTPIIDERENIYIGSSDRTFYAYSTKEQRMLWKIPTQEVIDSAGALHPNGTIIFPSGDGNIYCCDKLGNILWKFNVATNRTASRYSVATSYWWEGNIAIDAEGYIYAGNDDFFLYCLTPSGKIRWVFRTDLFIWATVAFAEPDIVYASSFDGSVYAIRRSTGKLLWKKDVRGPLIASPAIADGVVFQATLGGRVVAMHGKTGHILWGMQNPSHVYASPLVTPDGKVIVASSTGDIIAYNKDTGEKVWGWREFAVVRSSLVAAVEDNDAYTIYGGNGKGEVFALTPDGALQWRLTASLDETDPAESVINGSIALGQSGMAVPIGKSLYYVSYGYRDRASVLPPLIKRDGGGVSARELQRAEGYMLQGIHITMPTIIPTLDQIGLQSLQLPIVVIDRNSDTKEFLAYGRLQFGRDDDGNLVGVPRSQVYSFIFLGKETPHGVTLHTRTVYFETSGFPFPLDVLTIQAHKSFADTNAHIRADVIERGPIKTFREAIRAYRIANPPYAVLKGITTVAHVFVVPYVWMRLFIISSIFVLRKYWDEWDLFDEKGNVFITGVAQLVPKTYSGKENDWRIDSCKYNPLGEVVVTVSSLHSASRVDDLGMVLADGESMQPIFVNYSALVKRRIISEQVVTLRIDVPVSARPKSGRVVVYVLYNMEMIGSVECL